MSVIPAERNGRQPRSCVVTGANHMCKLERQLGHREPKTPQRSRDPRASSAYDILNIEPVLDVSTWSTLHWSVSVQRGSVRLCSLRTYWTCVGVMDPGLNPPHCCGQWFHIFGAVMSRRGSVGRCQRGEVPNGRSTGHLRRPSVCGA